MRNGITSQTWGVHAVDCDLTNYRIPYKHDLQHVKHYIQGAVSQLLGIYKGIVKDRADEIGYAYTMEGLEYKTEESVC